MHKVIYCKIKERPILLRRRIDMFDLKKYFIFYLTALFLMTAVFQTERGGVFQVPIVFAQSKTIGSGGEKKNQAFQNWQYKINQYYQEHEVIITEKNVNVVLKIPVMEIPLKEGMAAKLENIIAGRSKLLARKMKEKDNEVKNLKGYISLYIWGSIANIEIRLIQDCGDYSVEETDIFMYDFLQDRIIARNEIFVDGVDYMKLINDNLNSIIMNYGWTDEFLKRSFQGFAPEEIDFCIDMTRYESDGTNMPVLRVAVKKENRFINGNKNFEIPLEKLWDYIVIDPGKVQDIVNDKSILKRQLINRQDSIVLEYYKSNAIIGNSSILIRIANETGNNTISQINENLESWYCSVTAGMDMQTAKYMGFTRFNRLGPFLMVSIAGINSNEQYESHNALFDINTSKRLKIRDLLKPDSLKDLTDEQKEILDTYEFLLDENGNIYTGSWEKEQSGFSAYFDFDRFAYDSKHE